MIARILQSLSLCKGLEERELEMLAGVMQRRFVSQGEVLFDQGEAANCCYLLVSGRLGVYRSTPRGQPLRLATIEPGALVGELALLDSGPRTASVRAEERPATLLRLDRADFERILNARHRFACTLLDAIVVDLASRLRASTYRLAMVAADPNHDPTGVRFERALEAAFELFKTSAEHVAVRQKTLDLECLAAGVAGEGDEEARHSG